MASSLFLGLLVLLFCSVPMLVLSVSHSHHSHVNADSSPLNILSPPSPFRFAEQRGAVLSSSSNCPAGAIVRGAQCVCAAGYYGDSVGSNCQSCPAHSTSPIDSRSISQCQCTPGYEFLGAPLDPLVCTRI